MKLKTASLLGIMILGIFSVVQATEKINCAYSLIERMIVQPKQVSLNPSLLNKNLTILAITKAATKTCDYTVESCFDAAWTTFKKELADHNTFVQWEFVNDDSKVQKGNFDASFIDHDHDFNLGDLRYFNAACGTYLVDQNGKLAAANFKDKIIKSENFQFQTTFANNSLPDYCKGFAIMMWGSTVNNNPGYCLRYFTDPTHEEAICGHTRIEDSYGRGHT